MSHQLGPSLRQVAEVFVNKLPFIACGLDIYTSRGLHNLTDGQTTVRCKEQSSTVVRGHSAFAFASPQLAQERDAPFTATHKLLLAQSGARPSGKIRTIPAAEKISKNCVRGIWH